ncbi:esterase family protein [Runella salmonicolor]|uniref:Alpha/beta hydrolase-fold protein n=1 Tax=Runella salmonicolor TaxID=2950278 RepID=A0ABT1FQ16_9BACT|nr:alpha/beta hydrolase-fold protein [Runella salmonicolor]MCP1383832.1 alpha/beta hydrolase-fold protein [Runella salmonicolor]
MHRELDGWHSPALNKHMEIATYGHYGFALLMIPTAASDYLEYERCRLIESIGKSINEGKVKVFSVNSINTESWMNPHMNGRDKGIRHQQFNEYIYNEVIPYIKSKVGPDTPIIAAGASFGALHSANLYFRRPDLLNGVIAMSGCYDLTAYTKGHYDDNVYFNSPVHYLRNLKDEAYLSKYRSDGHIHIVTGSGSYEDPDSSRYLSDILHSKGVSHELDVWGQDIPHDWPSWQKMLPYYLETRF